LCGVGMSCGHGANPMGRASAPQACLRAGASGKGHQSADMGPWSAVYEKKARGSLPCGVHKRCGPLAKPYGVRNGTSGLAQAPALQDSAQEPSRTPGKGSWDMSELKSARGLHLCGVGMSCGHGANPMGRASARQACLCAGASGKWHQSADMGPWSAVYEKKARGSLPCGVHKRCGPLAKHLRSEERHLRPCPSASAAG
jgi:hypothetical protein